MTESGKRRVILPFAGGLAETNHVIGHELVHAFQSFAGGDRDWVRSAGVALRANVLGYAIAEIDYVGRSIALAAVGFGSSV